MAELIVRRIVLGLASLWVISVLVFAITELLPGDKAIAILGQEATPEMRQALEEKLGLDKPAHERYFHWLGATLRGDFGLSFATQAPIADIVETRMANSLRLAVLTALLAVPLSLALGLLCAAFAGSLFDRSTNVLSLLVVSLPEFVVGLLLVLLLAVKLKLLPAVAANLDASSTSALLRGLTLPVLTLLAAVQAQMIRMARAAVLDVMQRPYIEMARLKGASTSRIILRHALPNALGPIINVVALNLGYLVSGVVVVEVVFSYPGLGMLMVQSVSTRDMPVIQVTALIFCTTYVLLTLATDIIALLANPKLRLSR
jgi:peptide/nickel transport system permease protein